MLLPNELKTIIAEYAIRCEICFGHIIQNGRCQGCQIDKHPKKYYITWQSILEKQNIHLKLYEDTQVQFCNFQGEGIRRRTLSLDDNYYDYDVEPEMICCEAKTFLVIQILIDLQDENRQWFLLSDCVDHDSCPRDKNDFVAIVLYKDDEWRFLTHYETSFIFGTKYRHPLAIYLDSPGKRHPASSRKAQKLHYFRKKQLHHFRKKRKKSSSTSFVNEETLHTIETYS
jgi:hypothetical protein